MIKISNITYTYPNEKKPALSKVNFSINDGEWVTLIGHNGSGKSTIARIIDGLIDGFDGEIEVGGIKLDDSTVWDIRNQIGFVFQNPDNQFVGATVQDDVAFGLENRNIPRDEMVDRVTAALRNVSMLDFANREPATLSGGQKQRVALAGAIALKPSILILDEATSMLDPEGRKEVLDVIRQMHDEMEITIIMITHDISETELADRVVLINSGEIVSDTTPDELFQNTQVLMDNGLDIPFTEKLKNNLSAKGITLPEYYITEDGMVEFLCHKLK